MNKSDFDLASVIPSVRGVRIYSNGNMEILRNRYAYHDEFIESTTLQEDDSGTVAYAPSPNSERAKRSGLRGEVREFSKNSRVRMAWVLSNTSMSFSYMSTLTYGKESPQDNGTVNKHRDRVLAVVRRWYDSQHGTNWLSGNNVGYFWFIEFQKRGAIHIHLLLSHYVCSDRLLACWLKCNSELGNDIEAVSYVHSRASDNGTPFIMQKSHNQDELKHYGVKYSLKMYQKVPPKWFTGRFYGYSTNVKTECDSRYYECDEYAVRLMLEGHRVGDYDVLPSRVFGAMSQDVATLIVEGGSLP